MTDGIRNFMYTKHHGDNVKLRIFSFIPQQQRKQPNFMNDSIKSFIHTKQLNTHTPWTTKFCCIHIQTPQEIGLFRTFHPSQILYISSTPKNLYLACWAISYISSIPTWIRYQKLERYLYIIYVKLTVANNFIGNFYFFIATTIFQILCVCLDQILDRLYEEELLHTI